MGKGFGTRGKAEVFIAGQPCPLRNIPQVKQNDADSGWRQRVKLSGLSFRLRHL